MRYEESGAICSHSEEIEELESKLTAAQAEIARLREVLGHSLGVLDSNLVISPGKDTHAKIKKALNKGEL